MVGIVTGSGLDRKGIEALWKRRDFPHPSRLAFGPTQPPVQWYLASVRGSEVAGGVALTTHPH